MPLGQDAYKGLGLPAVGNAALGGVSTADVLTLEHSTADQGLFMTFRDAASSLDPLSSNEERDLLRLSAGGNIIGRSTVEGDNVLTGFHMPVVLTTVSRVLTVLESGTLFAVTSAVGTSMTFDLPAPGTNPAGVWYEFFVSSAAALDEGDVRIAATSATAAAIHGHGLVTTVAGAGTSVISTFAAITPLSTNGSSGTEFSFWCRLTALTSLLWVMENNAGYSSKSTLGAAQWRLGSTV